jgi:NhaP-type Na+/H+ or K+/H+ antiporter
MAGYLCGLLSAWMFKSISKPDKVVLLGLFLGSVYVPFLLSEMLQLSGIGK